MNIERKFWRVTRYARAARFWLLIVVALLAVFGIGTARASSCPRVGDAEGGGAWTTRAKALAACNAYAQCTHEEQVAIGGGFPNARCVNRSASVVGGSPYLGGYEPIYGGSGSTGYNIGDYFRYLSTCPSGSTWNNTTNTCNCPSGQTYSVENNTCGNCSARANISNKSTRGSWTATFCSDGCQFTPSSGASVCIGLGESGEPFCAAASWSPSGQTCSGGPTPSDYDPNKPTCMATGNGFSHCVEPDGRQCVTGAQGGRYCWSPGQTGPRSNSLGTEGATTATPPATPQKPPNMPDATGTPGATTVINNNTTTTVNWSGTGGTPGQGDVGPGGRDTGTGTGTGTGNGNGNGNGDGEGEGNTPGAPGAGVGTSLYTPSDKTIGSVYDDFQGRISNSAFIGAATGVFGGCSGAGSCPQETWSAPAFDITADLSALCSGILASLTAFAGWVALAGIGLFAWKVAFL